MQANLVTQQPAQNTRSFGNTNVVSTQVQSSSDQGSGKGKPVWVVRARKWKLRGGENRLSGLLEGVSIVSSGRQGSKGDRQWGGYALLEEQYVLFMLIHDSQIFYLSDVEYRYPNRVSIPKFNTGIWVSVPAGEGIGTPGIDTCHQGIGTKGGYRYPSPPLGLGYRYQLLENSFWAPL
ncbi:hypothetical protein GQ457_02G028490 [Hibiscus cannabinus]